MLRDLGSSQSLILYLGMLAFSCPWLCNMRAADWHTLGCTPRLHACCTTGCIVHVQRGPPSAWAACQHVCSCVLTEPHVHSMQSRPPFLQELTGRGFWGWVWRLAGGGWRVAHACDSLMVGCVCCCISCVCMSRVCASLLCCLGPPACAFHATPVVVCWVFFRTAFCAPAKHQLHFAALLLHPVCCTVQHKLYACAFVACVTVPDSES